MSEHRIHIALGKDSIARIAAALNTLETELIGLASFTAQERRDLVGMSEAAEALVRKAVLVLDEHDDVLPDDFDLESFQADLATLDVFRPLFARIGHLYDRATGTEMALRNDLVLNAIEGYAWLEAAGKSADLDALRKAMSQRLGRGSRGAPTPSSQAQD